MVTIGYNIDTSSINFERAIESMKASKASHHLVMIDSGSPFLQNGDLDTIRKYLNALPNVNLIIRVYSVLEGQWQNYPSAAEYENHWRWVKGQLGALTNRLIFDDCCNEPNLAGDNQTEAKKYVDRCIKLSQAASNAGIKLALCAFSIGTPHESLFETVYYPLFKVHKTYSLHLYGCIPFEAGEFAPLDAVLDAKTARNHMVDNHWPESYQGWLIGRSYRFIQTFAKYNLGLPELYVTEAAIDNIFNSSNAHIKEAWRSKYGIDAFNRDPRGARAWERYLKEMFPEFDFPQALKALYRHARKNIFYSPAFKAVCIFALNAQWDYAYEGHPDGRHKEAGSNYDYPSYSAFRATYLGEINSEVYGTVPPVEPPTIPPLTPFPPIDSPLWQNGTLRLSEDTNLRPQPSTALAPIIRLPSGSYVASQYDENKSGSGYTWKAYILKAGFPETEYRGWIANEVIGEWIPDEETPPPVPEKRYAIDWGLSELSESELATLKTLLGQWLEALNEASEIKP